MLFLKKTLDEIFRLSFNREHDSYDSIEKMHENCIDQECYIDLIAQILKVYKFFAIKPLLSKQSVTIQSQSEKVLKELGFDGTRCDIEFKRLGHILNKLAEFQDPILTGVFLEKVTQKFNEITETQSESQEISDLLRNFHMFITKTPTESKQQIKAVRIVQQYIRNNVSDPAKVVFFPEVFIYSQNHPFALGTVDGAVLIPCKGKYHLIILEYDGGVGKTRSDKNYRIKKYADGTLGNISFTAKGMIKDEYVTKEFDVSSVEVVSIQREDYLPKDRLYKLLNAMGVTKKNGRLYQRKITPSVENKYAALNVENKYAALEEDVDDETRSNPPCDAYLASPNPESTSLPSEPSGATLEDRYPIYKVKDIFNEKLLIDKESDDYASPPSSDKPRPIIYTVKEVFNFIKSISNCARRYK